MNRRSFFSRLVSATAGIVIASSVEVFGCFDKPLLPVNHSVDLTLFKEWFVHWNSDPDENYYAKQQQLEKAIALESGIA